MMRKAKSCRDLRIIGMPVRSVGADELTERGLPMMRQCHASIERLPRGPLPVTTGTLRPRLRE